MFLTWCYFVFVPTERTDPTPQEQGLRILARIIARLMLQDIHGSIEGVAISRGAPERQTHPSPHDQLEATSDEEGTRGKSGGDS